MIVLRMAYLLAEAEGGGDFQLHLRAVFRIPSPALRLPVHRHGKGIIPYQLLNILADAIGVAILLRFKLTTHLVAEPEGNPLVHYRLTAQHVPEVICRNVNIREHLFVRLPVKNGAGLFPVGGFFFQAAHISALFKVQIIPEAIPADGSVKKLRGVLGGAGAQAVQAQGVLVVLSVFPVFAAGIHFTEYQLPVEPLFLFVVVHRAATAKVLHFHRKVLIPGDNHRIAVTLSGFVDGVGQNFKHCMLTAFQIIGAKDNRRAFSHPFFPFQHGNAGIAILFLFRFSHGKTCQIS